MPNKLYDQLSENHPFLTLVGYGQKEYIGIILNKDNHITTMYDIELIPTVISKKHFLKLGEIWWWESNRLIPITVFLRDEIQLFADYIRSFNSKDVEIIHGPCVCLNDLATKRTKKRSIQMPRRKG